MRSVTFSDFTIKFERNDPYWSRLISNRFRYELEVENWLRRECTPDVFFIDCGANIGYWTVFVSKVLGAEKVIAIEPNMKIFGILLENLQQNNLAAFAIHGAVGEKIEGEDTINLYINSKPGNHVGASIYKENTESTNEIVVPLIDLSKLIDLEKYSDSKIVLKLDVEGAEIACFKQIPLDARNRVTIIFEDHGRDKNCEVTKWILDTNAYKVGFLGANGITEIDAVETLKNLKRSEKRGYNLVARPIGSD